MALSTTFKTQLRITGVDHTTGRYLEQMVSIYGIRTVIHAIEQVCDYRAEKSAELFNTVQAKQWARWSTEIEAIVGSSKLTDPGRE